MYSHYIYHSSPPLVVWISAKASVQPTYGFFYPEGVNCSDGILLFPEKEAKSVSSASQKAMGYPKLGEADPGQNYTLSHFLLFQKRSKSVSSASQKTMGYPNLGEADPGGLGACPQQNSTLSGFFFSRKEAKALVLLRRRLWATQTSAKPTQGVWGRAPSKTLR
jgi:hypothetical protein